MLAPVGALGSICVVRLASNQIGDAGCTALTETCGREALANLRELYLFEHEIANRRHSGCTLATALAVRPARQRGALAFFTKQAIWFSSTVPFILTALP